MFTESDGMTNKMLKSIGQKLNISDQEIKSIQNTAVKEKLVKLFIHPILIGILSILTFIFGISLGGGCTNCAGYPFHAAAGLAVIPEKRKGLTTYRLVIPIITFIAGYLVGRTFFSYAIMYNVYKRSKI
jgi:hypothetical protein